MSSEVNFAEVNEVIAAYHNLMASEGFREYERQREKAELDERQRIYYAIKEATAEKDTIIEEKDTIIEEKDATLREQAALIAELQAKLAEK